MSCLPSYTLYYDIPSTLWPLPGEKHLPSIYLPDGRHGGELEVARDYEIYKIQGRKTFILIYSKLC